MNVLIHQNHSQSIKVVPLVFINCVVLKDVLHNMNQITRRGGIGEKGWDGVGRRGIRERRGEGS